MKEIIRFYTLWKLKIIFCYRERDERLRKAESEGISFENANKLRGQAASISFEDISTCVNVSVVRFSYSYKTDQVRLEDLFIQPV